MTNKVETSTEHAGDQAAENEEIPSSPDGMDEVAVRLARHELHKKHASQWSQNRIPPDAWATAIYSYRAEGAIYLSFPKGAKIVDIVDTSLLRSIEDF